MVIRGVVFDMDDTLCLERDYVKSGFRAVARHAAPDNPEPVFNALWQMFESGVRGDTFNRLLEQFPEVAAKCTIPDLVEAYRSHAPDIAIIPAMREILLRLRQEGVKLGLLSDGPLVSQQAKADALGVAELVDCVVLTDAMGRECWKPSPAGFERLARQLELEHCELAYIGDNPAKDFIAPNILGWQTIRVRLSDQLREQEEPQNEQAAPRHDVSDIPALAALLDELRHG